MNSWENGIIKSNPIVRINLLTVPKVTVSTLSGKKTTVSFEVKVKEAPKAESAK